VGNTALTNAQAGLRLGEDPRAVFTTTPRVTPEVKAIYEDDTGSWVMTRMATWDNQANLAPSFIDVLRRQYEGTRLAAQEFEGLLVEEVEGALWHLASLDASRVKPTDPQPMLIHRAVAVDPSVAFRGEGDECGIIAGGVGIDRRMYATHDFSMSGEPDAWARRVVDAYYATGAQVVIAEGNNGGAMVSAMIHNIDPTIPVETVYASDGKRARAEPVAQLWEPGPSFDPADSGSTSSARASLVGYLPDLESQLTGWSKFESESPDRLDALAWLGHWCMERMWYAPAGFSRKASATSVRTDLSGQRRPEPAVAADDDRPSRRERLAAIRARRHGTVRTPGRGLPAAPGTRRNPR
jgi:phage terminase large subunit-like protein